VKHKSPGKSKEKCWNYGKVVYFKRDCKEDKKNTKKQKNDYDDEFEKYSQDYGGDAFVASLETHVDQSAWSIDSGDSFHMTSHRH
jgi:hypothetical protein